MVRLPAGTRDLSLQQSAQTGSGKHPTPIECYLGVKKVGSEFDHCTPSSVEFDERSCTSTPK